MSEAETCEGKEIEFKGFNEKVMGSETPSSMSADIQSTTLVSSKDVPLSPYPPHDSLDAFPTVPDLSVAISKPRETLWTRVTLVPTHSNELSPTPLSDLPTVSNPTQIPNSALDTFPWVTSFHLPNSSFRPNLEDKVVLGLDSNDRRPIRSKKQPKKMQDYITY